MARRPIRPTPQAGEVAVNPIPRDYVQDRLAGIIARPDGAPIAGPSALGREREAGARKCLKGRAPILTDHTFMAIAARLLRPLAKGHDCVSGRGLDLNSLPRRPLFGNSANKDRPEAVSLGKRPLSWQGKAIPALRAGLR
jgi:hypothetical protein